jgi:glutaredoxin 2
MNEEKSEKELHDFIPTLYAYFHCPFCVRVKLFLGLKKIPHRVVYLDHHDEKAHTDKVGEKTVPILEWAPNKYMKESIDIINYLDGLKQYGPTLLKSVPAGGGKLSSLIQELGGIPPTAYYWRLMAIDPPLPEFRTQQAKTYFIQKKTRQLNLSFKEAKGLELGDLLDFGIKLAEISHLIKAPSGLHGENLTTMDDIKLFPILWASTLIAGFKMPKPLKEYTDTIMKRSASAMQPWPMQV